MAKILPKSKLHIPCCTEVSLPWHLERQFDSNFVRGGAKHPAAAIFHVIPKNKGDLKKTTDINDSIMRVYY